MAKTHRVSVLAFPGMAPLELGVVVGRDGGVFGYTVMNDVSSRDEQLDGDQWLLGKSIDQNSSDVRCR